MASKAETVFTFPLRTEFTIELTIPKLSTLKEQTSSMTSDEITIGRGLAFSLSVIPLYKETLQGHVNPTDYVGVFLNKRCALTDKRTFEADLDINVVDPDTNDTKCPFRRICSETFGPQQGTWIRTILLCHSDIWGPAPRLILTDDILKLRATVTLRALDPDEDSCLSSKNQLATQYRLMYDSSIGRDFILASSDGTESHVHKAVLKSASPVFSRMFESNLEENQTGRCEISDVDAVTLDALVRYMYYGSVENLKEHAKDVLIAADKYELLGLKEHCEDVLSNTITTENVAEILLFADKICAARLKTAAIRYLSQNPAALSSKETDAIFSCADSKLIKEVITAMIRKPSLKRPHEEESSDDDDDEDDLPHMLANINPYYPPHGF